MFTFQQIADLFYQRIDQAGTPALDPDETDRLLNQAYRDWYKQNRPNFNRDQSVTVNMAHLLKPFTFTAISEITIGATGSNLPLYKDLANMRGQFNKTNCGGVVAPFWRSIRPVPLNAVDTNAQDPFNTPIDDDPQYSQENNGTFKTIKIRSTNMPLQVEGNYFIAVPVIDSENTPNGVFAGPDEIVDDIVEIAKALYKTDIDDYESVEETLKENAMKV